MLARLRGTWSTAGEPSVGVFAIMAVGRSGGRRSAEIEEILMPRRALMLPVVVAAQVTAAGAHISRPVEARAANATPVSTQTPTPSPTPSPSTMPPPTPEPSPAPSPTPDAPCDPTPTTAPTPPAPPPPTPATVGACDGPLVTLGGTTDVPYVDNAVQDCTRFELRGWYSNAPGLNANHAFAVGGNGPANLSVSGGVVNGHIPLDWSWRRTHTYGGYAFKTVVGRGWATLENVRVHNVEDGWKPREQPPFSNGGAIRMRGAYMTGIRDDAVENDEFMPGSVEDSLFDGVWTFFSEQNQSGGVPDTIGADEDLSIRIDRVYVRLWATNGDEPGPGRWFKWQPRRAKSHVPVISDSVFATQQMPRHGWRTLSFPTGTIFRGTNYILWLGSPGGYGGPRPDGVIVLEGQEAMDKWNQVRNDWLAAHGYDPRPADDWDPMNDPAVAPR
jgi:hypothetical protein